MLTIEPATLARLPAGRFEYSSLRPSQSGSFFVPWNKFRTLTDSPCTRRNNFGQHRVRASAKEQSDPIKQNPKPQRYHPFEDIEKSGSIEIGEARLTPAETTRTVVEVNSKAMLIVSGLLNEDLDENIFWPDLPYVTDEHGNIYFRVKNDEDILKTLTSEDIPVLVVIGLDAAEMINEIESLGQSEVDFGFDEIDVEDSDMDDEDDEDDSDDDDDDDDEQDDEDEDEDEDDEDGNYEKDWVGILEDEDLEDLDESLGDWAKLETMRSSHPMYFAKKMAEFVSEDPVDFMDQPPAGLAIQAILRPAFVDENSVINKRTSDHQSNNDEANQTWDVVEDKQEDLVTINGQKHELGSSQDGSIWAKELEKDESLGKGTSFYKLEIIKIQLILAHGDQAYVEVEDFRRAQPDAIAHSAAKIISRIKAGGEKTKNALKSLCWRCKGIQVEEVALIGVDSLGFDLRVCSGAQVQTLRFAFDKRASSEYGAERQLNDLLFPRIHGKQQKKKEAHQSEL